MEKISSAEYAIDHRLSRFRWMPETFTASYEQHCQAVIQANTLNKALVFEALAQAKITALAIDFDGEGDSGQLNDIIVRAGDELVKLPETFITMHYAQWNTDQLATHDMPLQEAIETLCYDYLEQEHDGWENNDGAYGEFRFDVPACTIELEFHGRIIDVLTSNHTF